MGIKMKRSSVAGKAPTTTDLELGELAINTTDGKVYTKKSVGGVEIIVELLTVLSSSFLRNRIINGSMDIWQRGTSFTSQSAYAADRWFCNRSGGASGVTFYQAFGAFGVKKNFMAVQRASGDTNTAAATIYQAIEGVNSRDFAGKNVTISCLLGTGGTLSSTTNNFNIQLAYQTTGTDIGPNGSWTVIAGTPLSVPSNTGPTVYSATFAVPSTATQLIAYIGFGFAGTAGADDRYYITDIQLEEGSVRTPFERRQYGQELALCQRYYILKPFVVGTATINSTVDLPVSMRAVPTIGTVTFDAGTGAAFTPFASTTGVYQYLNHSTTATAFIPVSAEL